MSLNVQRIIGNNRGAENSDMFFLAEAKYNINIGEKSCNKTKDEFVDLDLNELIEYN
jgi:hypothetical protein